MTYQEQLARLLAHMGDRELHTRPRPMTAAAWWADHPGERDLRWTPVDLLAPEPGPPKDGDEFI